MVTGHWCGPRSNLHIDAANADDQLQFPKTQHDWIAIGKDAQTDDMEQWYIKDTTIAFDPTHYQFSRNTTERFVWSAKDCIEVKHRLAPDYKKTCIKYGCLEALLEERNVSLIIFEIRMISFGYMFDLPTCPCFEAGMCEIKGYPHQTTIESMS